MEMPPLANQPPQEVSAKGTKMTDRETEGPIKVRRTDKSQSVHSKAFTPEQAAI